MALSKIQFKQQDGNLFAAQEGEDHISALIFDVNTFPTSSSNTGKDGDVYEVFSPKEAETLGFKPYDVNGDNYEAGVPHYHISEYFRMKPNGHLFIGVRDMATAGNFGFVKDVQRVAQGRVRQVGVYTKQKLFTAGAQDTDPYILRLVPDLQNVADALDIDNMPLDITLQANMTNINTVTTTDPVTGEVTVSGSTVTNLTQIPSIISTYKNVAVLLGQGNSDIIKDIQAINGVDKAVVGCIGTAVGCVSNAGVGESIGWVAKFNLAGAQMDTVALGFGDTTDESGTSKRLKNNYPLELLTPAQLDDLEGKGFILPIKYVGNAGTYFSSDRTASNGDFRTISRGRAVNKAKRLVRAALTPTLNESLLIDGVTGYIALSTIKRFKTLVSNVLAAMKPTEISDFEVFIDPKQNILATDTLTIRFSIVPLGTNKNVMVEVGFTQKLNA
jgi:hypothetical protein